MAYSYSEIIASGGNTFNIPFDYIEQSEISVFVDGVSTSFTFTSSNVIDITPAPTQGAVVRIARDTNLTSRAVDFASGAVLTEEDLDNSNIQVFHAAQEAIDKANAAISLDVDGKWEAESNGTARVIKNIADPVNANDAVNKSWAETGMSSQLAQATTQATTATSAAATATTKASEAAASATTASTGASTATTKAGEASASATSAATSATTATTQASTATTQAGIATTKAGEASTSATAAAGSASTASTQAGVATSAATTATSQASTATTQAGIATTQAATATTKAGEASTSATSAATSASQAQGYRDTTLGYRDSAATSATSALSSKNAAATSETNAATSAATATTKASEASASAVSAAQSAASAASVLDNFDDRYLGAKTADPSVDNDGDPLVVGALYFNSTDGVMKTYTASGWLAASSASVATMAKFKFTATAGQTVFTGTDDGGDTLSMTVGSEIVTLNGIVLEAGTDYTPASGSVTLATGATADDEVNVYAFGNFQVADTVSKSLGGTFTGAVTFDSGVTVNSGTANTVAVFESSDAKAVITFKDNSSTFGSSVGTEGEDLRLIAAGVDAVRVHSGNDVSFYEDTGTTAKLFWDASAESLGIGTTTPSAPLDIDGSSTSSSYGALRAVGAGTGAGSANVDLIADFGIGTSGSVSGVWLGGRTDETTAIIGAKTASGNIAFEVYENGWKERMRIDNAGRVTMPYQPAVFATCRGSGRANGVSGRVVYGNVQNNVGNHYNAGVFTAPIAGSYMVVASALNQQGGSNQIWIRKNGVQVSSSIYFNAYDETGAATACLYLQAGDYIDAYTPLPHYESDYGDFACHLVG